MRRGGGRSRPRTERSPARVRVRLQILLGGTVVGCLKGHRDGGVQRRRSRRPDLVHRNRTGVIRWPPVRRRAAHLPGGGDHEDWHAATCARRSRSHRRAPPDPDEGSPASPARPGRRLELLSRSRVPQLRCVSWQPRSTSSATARSGIRRRSARNPSSVGALLARVDDAGSGSPAAFSTSGAATRLRPPTARGRSRTPIQAGSCSGSGSVIPTSCRLVATSTRRPVETMRAYLDGIDAAPYLGHEPEETPPRLLAALAPRMLALAAERSAGSITYFVPPEHTVAARGASGRTDSSPSSKLSCSRRIAARARELARPYRRVLQRRRQLPAQPAPARLDGGGDRERRGRSSSTHSWRTAAMKRSRRVCGRISMRAPTTSASRHCRARTRSSSSSGSWRRCFETCDVRSRRHLQFATWLTRSTWW